MTNGVFKSIPSKDVKLHDKFYAHKSWNHISGSNDGVEIEELYTGSYENEICRKYAMINTMFFEYSPDCYKTFEYIQNSANNFEITASYQIGNKNISNQSIATFNSTTDTFNTSTIKWDEDNISTTQRFQPNFNQRFQPNSIRYVQSNVNIKNTLPSNIICISIPQSKIGMHIHYGSVAVSTGNSVSLIDNSHGELIYKNNVIGRIMYSAGIIVIYNNDKSFNTDNINVQWKSTVMLYQNHVLIRTKKDEFNVSMNPTLIDDIETGLLKNIVINDAFTPYITTIGLYNDTGDLLAVARLSKPIPKRNDIDINFLIKWDY